MLDFVQYQIADNRRVVGDPSREDVAWISSAAALIGSWVRIASQKSGYFWNSNISPYFSYFSVNTSWIMDEEQLLDYDEEQTEVNAEAPAGENGDSTKLKVGFIY